MGILLYVICCFFLISFSIFSLCLIFASSINIYLGMFLLGFILYWTLCAFLTWVIVSFTLLGSFSNMKWSESHSVVSNSLWPHGLYIQSMEFSRPEYQATRVGSLSLLQGIFPTQGSNPDLPHCRQILYQLSHQGSPWILEWVAYLFSSKSSWPRSWTRVSCIVGGFFPKWATRGALFNYNLFTFYFQSLSFWKTYNAYVGMFNVVPEVSKTVLISFYSFLFILCHGSNIHHSVF